MDNESRFFCICGETDKGSKDGNVMDIDLLAYKQLYIQPHPSVCYLKLDRGYFYPDEDLREWNDEFDKRIAQLQDKINKSTRDITDIETKSSLSQQQIEDYIGKVGNLEAEFDNYTSLKKERDSTIQGLYRQHNLGSLSKTPFSNEVASNHIIRLKSRLKDLDRN
ncbi:hypothetical protein L1887_31279 [Cichorium endivia]|nr:hypothetical protein L1887_31279 [Cichorium endivia]